MEDKQCITCGCSKERSDFYKKGKVCKKCISIKTKEFRENNKEEIKRSKAEYYKLNRDKLLNKSKSHYNLNKDKALEKAREYRDLNRDKIIAYRKEYRALNKDKLSERKKLHWILNKEKVAAKSKEYYELNKEGILEKVYEYRALNKDRIFERSREYRKSNKQKLNHLKLIYHHKRYKTDPIYKFKKTVRSLIQHTIRRKGFKKKNKALDILGIDLERLKNYLEYTYFQNYGEEYTDQVVHIDHIIPMASAKTEEDVIKLNHYSNLQYLTPEDNLSKADKVYN